VGVITEEAVHHRVRRGTELARIHVTTPDEGALEARRAHLIEAQPEIPFAVRRLAVPRRVDLAVLLPRTAARVGAAGGARRRTILVRQLVEAVPAFVERRSRRGRVAPGPQHELRA